MAANAEAALPSAWRQPGAAVLVSLALACVLTDGMGVALLFGADDLTFGYRAAGDLGAAGARVLDLPKLMLELGLLAWLLTLALLVCRVARRRKPALRRACRWGIALSVVALLFAPGWMDLSVEHFDGPGRSTRLDFGNPAFPLLAYTTKTERETGPSGTPQADQPYLCTISRGWKLAGARLQTTFYPSLDEKRQSQLLQSSCTELPKQEGAHR